MPDPGLCRGKSRERSRPSSHSGRYRRSSANEFHLSRWYSARPHSKASDRSPPVACEMRLKNDRLVNERQQYYNSILLRLLFVLIEWSYTKLTMSAKCQQNPAKDFKICQSDHNLYEIKVGVIAPDRFATYRVCCRITPQNSFSGRSNRRLTAAPDDLRDIQWVPSPSEPLPPRHPPFQRHQDAPVPRRLNL